MPSLMDLFPEILEEVVMKLESVEDVISLGSSSTDLARIIGQERIWRGVLAKTRLVEDGRVKEDRVRMITTFLSSIANSNAIFSLLHETIYERYPATVRGWENITVSFPSSPQLYSVTGLGLEVLALTAREDARHAVHKINMSRISRSLLLSHISIQREQITELVVMVICCTTAEEGRALVSLLQSSTTWRAWTLHLSGQMDIDFLCQECGQTFNARWKLESYVKCKHDSKTYKPSHCLLILSTPITSDLSMT